MDSEGEDAEAKRSMRQNKMRTRQISRVGDNRRAKRGRIFSQSIGSVIQIRDDITGHYRTG